MMKIKLKYLNMLEQIKKGCLQIILFCIYNNFPSKIDKKENIDLIQ